MYKVVIIDDDPIIRKGLTQTIKWDDYDFAVCGEAGDGLSGLELVKKKKPHLIITDIKMPGLTGFEMLEEIKKFNPESEILIITAYRNFDYAKDALLYGARDLLLKPTKMDEIISAVKAVSEQLKRKEKIREEQKKQKELFKKNIPVLRNKLIHDLIFGLEIHNDSLKEKIKFLKIDWKDYYLLIARFSDSDLQDLSAYEKYLRLFAISAIFENSFSSGFSCVNIGIRGSQIGMVIGLDSSKKNAIKNIREISEEAIITVRENFSQSVTISLSSKHGKFNELPNAWQEANVTADQSFFIGSDIVAEYGNLNEYTIEDENFCSSDFDELLYATRGGNSEIIREWKESKRSFCTSSEDVETVKGKYWDLLSKIISVRKSIPEESAGNEAGKNSLELFSHIYNAGNVKELNRIIIDAAIDISEQVRKNQQQGITDIVNKARNYIDENYSEQITLGDVADNVFVSSSYLSRIFKRVTNLNFSEYVNKVRIGEAKRLLIESDLMTYQIGEAVGYSDPHYFSRIFKKITGHSPTYFRDGKEKPLMEEQG